MKKFVLVLEDPELLKSVPTPNTVQLFNARELIDEGSQLPTASQFEQGFYVVNGNQSRFLANLESEGTKVVLKQLNLACANNNKIGIIAITGSHLDQSTQSFLQPYYDSGRYVECVESNFNITLKKAMRAPPVNLQTRSWILRACAVLILIDIFLLGLMVLFPDLYDQSLQALKLIGTTDKPLEPQFAQLDPAAVQKLEETLSRTLTQQFEAKLNQSINQKFDEILNQKSDKKPLNQKLPEKGNTIDSQRIEENLNQKLTQKLEAKLDQLITQKIEDTLNQKLAQKLEVTLDQALNKKLDERLNSKMEEHGQRVKLLEGNLNKQFGELKQTLNQELDKKLNKIETSNPTTSSSTPSTTPTSSSTPSTPAPSPTKPTPKKPAPTPSTPAPSPTKTAVPPPPPPTKEKATKPQKQAANKKTKV